MTGLCRELHDECLVMIRYLMSRGRRIPSALVAKVSALETGEGDERTIRSLAGVHCELSELVAPATPRSLALLEAEAADRSRLRFLGPVHLARRLAVVAVFFLLVVVGIEVSQGHHTDDLFHLGEQVPPAVHFGFLAASAGLGATFAALFKVHRELAQNAYDPDTESTYWSEVILGLIAGLLLSEFLTETQTETHALSRPLLAVLGGFSGVVVNSILNRLVGSLQQLFGGETDRLQDELEQTTRRRATQAVGQARLQLAGQLLQLQRQLDVDPAAGRRALAEILDSLLPLESGTPHEEHGHAADAGVGPDDSASAPGHERGVVPVPGQTDSRRPLADQPSPQQDRAPRPAEATPVRRAAAAVEGRHGPAGTGG